MMRAVQRFVQQTSNRLLRKILLGSGIGILNLSDEQKKTRKLQVSLLEAMVRDGVNNPEPYGFTSRALKGAIIYWLALGGDLTKLTSLITSDPRYRPTDLEEGETKVYHFEGDFIHLKNGRIIKVVSGNEIQVEATNKVTVTSPLVHVVASTKVTFETPLVEATQDMQVGGNLSVAGAADVGGNVDVGGDVAAGGDVSDVSGSMQGMRDTYDTHSLHPPKDNGQGM